MISKADDDFGLGSQPQAACQIDYSTLHQELSYTSLITGSYVPPPAASVVYLTPSETSPDEPDPTSPKESSHGILPEFAQSLASNISPQDLEFLSLKGALTVPEINLRNALVRSFVEFVHPWMPVVDLVEFLLAVCSSDTDRPKTSLLLFQAIMFSAVAFVDGSLLENSGFTSRKAARKQFYERTKVRTPHSLPSHAPSQRLMIRLAPLRS